jgi:mono/diheme cytochrome c family protein
MASLSLRRVGRILAHALPLLLGVPFLSGCYVEGYPTSLKYPSRTDPIILETLTTELPHPDKPGQLPVLSWLSLTQPDNPLQALSQGNKALDPLKVNVNQREQLAGAIDELFGTPARPKVETGNAETDTKLQQVLKLDRTTLGRGSWLYRIHCLHCHGLPGDGRGPTAFWVNPHPRDYRQGIFKFVSSSQARGKGQKPRRADLLRTLHVGIDGTSMPSFAVLGDADLEPMVSYVIHLSLRGEVEMEVLTELVKSEGKLEEGKSVEGSAKELADVFAGRWLEAQDMEIKPPPYPYKTDDEVKAAVQRGHAFFMDAQNGCVKCHPNYGRDSLFRYDDWGTMVRPADLTTAIYRGGRRPLDLYWRIHAGINGSGMAGFNEVKLKKDDKDSKLESLWDVVKFVEILPYPAMRVKYGINID